MSNPMAVHEHGFVLFALHMIKRCTQMLVSLERNQIKRYFGLLYALKINLVLI